MPLSFYDNNNRMDANPPYLYDAAGNLLNDGVHTYAYDAENRLISVDGGATASYVYDAEGRRVHENVGGVVKEYIDGQSGQELSVVDANQNLLQGETCFGGRYLGTATASGFAWAQTDELGTVRARTNSSGGLTETDTSWPFGEYLNQVGVTSNLHFTGKYRDGETGLDYFGARYYSSSLGRFLTPDWSDLPEPIPYADLENPQSLNLYSYVLNNPASATDPDGHWCFLGFGSTCTKAAKLPVKEGSVAASGTADGIVGGIDTEAVLAGMQSVADAVTTAAGTAVEASAGVAGALLTLSEPLNPGEDQIMARVRAASADKSGAQDKKLTPGEIGKLEGAGHDVHDIKKKFGSGTVDLYKDPQGNIYVKPKGSPGKGEPIGININNVH